MKTNLLVKFYTFFIILVQINITVFSYSQENYIYFVGEYGRIDKYNLQFEQIDSMQIQGLTRDRFIRDACLSVDKKFIYLAVSTAETPLFIVDAKNFSLVEVKHLKFPLFPTPYFSYLPLEIFSPYENTIFICDESLVSAVPSMPWIKIDLSTNKVLPLSLDLFSSKELTKVSPDHTKMIAYHDSTFRILAIPSLKIISAIDVSNLLSDDKRLLDFDVDWKANKIKLFMDASEGTIEATFDISAISEKLSKDLPKNLTKTLLETEYGNAPRYLAKISKRRGNMNVSSMTDIDILNSLQSVQDTENIQKYSRIAANVDLSSDQKYLFIQRNWSENEKSRSAIIVYDLLSKTEFKEIKFQEQIIGILQ